ncbi:MAG: DUF2231 domain-containing protein, partial [Actinomycetes bacterium]
MFDTILGLPVHALVVHFVVVLVPLGALGVVAIALVPRWRDRFGLLVLAVTTAGLLAVPVATQSGKKLQARLHAGGIVAAQIRHHRSMGRLVIYPTVALWILCALLLLLTRRGATGRPMVIVAVLAVLAAAAAAAQVTIA